MNTGRESTSNSQEKTIREFINNPNSLSIYANGFATALGISDITIVLQRSEQSVAQINMSYTLAKTLAIHLGALVTNLEEAADTKILTTNQISESLERKKQNA